MRPKVLITASTLPRHESDPQPRFILDFALSLRPWIDPSLLAPSHPAAQSEGGKLAGLPHYFFRYAPRRWETLAYAGGIPTRLRQNRLRWLFVPGFALGLYWKTRQLCRTEHFDAVLANWIMPQGVVQSLQPGTPYFLYMHGADAFTLNNVVLRQMKARALRRARHVFIVSKAMKNKLKQMFPWLDDGKCTHLPTGVNSDVFHPNRAGPDVFGGMQGPIVLFVGRLDYKKGVGTLIEAWNLLHAGRAGKGTLVIIGSGPLEAELRQRAASGPARDRIVFMPPIPHDRLPAYMASADIFCCPSTEAPGGDREGRPTVLIEAAASGRGILASQIGGIDEFIVSGENGWLVPANEPRAWAEAIERLAADPARCRELGAHARRDAEQEDWRMIGERASRIMAAELTIPRA